MFTLSFLKPVLWLFPILIILVFLKSPIFKGWLGEKLVETKAKRKLPPEIYQPFQNVTIPDGAGTTQIDHIYVSPFGIFVVETKNYKGWIFGRESDPQWTQSIFGKKSRFQNPLRQNYKHTKTLENLLDLSSNAFKSVVIFVGNCEFKTPLPPNVCTLANFDKFILSFQSRIFTSEQIYAICQKLESGRLEKNRATNRAHIKYLRNKHK